MAIRVKRTIRANYVIDTLSDLFIIRGTPQFISSDNCPEFVAGLLRSRLHNLGVTTAFTEPCSQWENGYTESFNGNFRDELPNRETFNTVLQAKVVTDGWRMQYNTVRPHSSLGYRSPAPEAFYPVQFANA